MKRYFLLLLLLVPFVSAEDILIKQNTPYDLKVPCFINGTLCGASALCNATIVDVDGSSLFNNYRMTNNLSYFNITLSSSKNLKLGEKQVTITCCQGAECNYAVFPIQVTPGGTDDSGVNNITLLGFGLLFSVGVMAFGINKQDAWLVLFGSLGLILIGLYCLLNGIGNYRNTITEGSSIIIMGIATYIGLKAGVEAIDA